MDILHGLHTIVRLIYETLASLYYALLLIGAIGIAVQGLLGFMHGGAHEGHAGHADAGGHHVGDIHLGNHHTPTLHHTPGAPAAGAANAGAPSAPVLGHAHGGAAIGGATHNGGHAVAAGSQPHSGPHGASNGGKPGAGAVPHERDWSGLWSWLSPLTIFSVCLGTGAAGLLLVAHLGKPLTALVALVCGIAFYALITKPMMRIVLSFASRPAETLAGAVAKEAIAIGRFDAQGRGMVTVTVDGELKRLLAHLDREDTQNAVPVAPGDKLLVVSIDPHKNTCAVIKAQLTT